MEGWLQRRGMWRYKKRQWMEIERLFLKSVPVEEDEMTKKKKKKKKKKSANPFDLNSIANVRSSGKREKHRAVSRKFFIEWGNGKKVKLRASSVQEKTAWLNVLRSYTQEERKSNITIPASLKQAIKVCLDFLAVKGVESEDLFRGNGNKTRVRDLFRILVVQGHASVPSTALVDDVAALTKVLIKRLPETLLTSEKFEHFSQAAEAQNEQELIRLTQSLPSESNSVLGQLLHVCITWFTEKRQFDLQKKDAKAAEGSSTVQTQLQQFELSERHKQETCKGLSVVVGATLLTSTTSELLKKSRVIMTPIFKTWFTFPALCFADLRAQYKMWSPEDESKQKDLVTKPEPEIKDPSTSLQQQQTPSALPARSHSAAPIVTTGAPSSMRPAPPPPLGTTDVPTKSTTEAIAEETEPASISTSRPKQPNHQLHQQQPLHSHPRHSQQQQQHTTPIDEAPHEVAVDLAFKGRPQQEVDAVAAVLEAIVDTVVEVAEDDDVSNSSMSVNFSLTATPTATIKEVPHSAPSTIAPNIPVDIVPNVRSHFKGSLHSPSASVRVQFDSTPTSQLNTPPTAVARLPAGSPFIPSSKPADIVSASKSVLSTPSEPADVTAGNNAQLLNQTSNGNEGNLTSNGISGFHANGRNVAKQGGIPKSPVQQADGDEFLLSTPTIEVLLNPESIGNEHADQTPSTHSAKSGSATGCSNSNSNRASSGNAAGKKKKRKRNRKKKKAAHP